MLVTWKESDWWFTKSNKNFTCKKSPTTRKENLQRILKSLGWNQAGLRSEGGEGGRGKAKNGYNSGKNKVVVFPLLRPPLSWLRTPVFFVLTDFFSPFVPTAECGPRL